MITLSERMPGWLKTVVNIIAFQICWMACVIGGNTTALLSLAGLLLIHIGLILPKDAQERRNEIFLIMAVFIFGFTFDNALYHAGFIHFPYHQGMIIPVWLMILWLAFATTLKHSLSRLTERPLIATAFASIGAPWSYFLGTQLEAIEITPAGMLAIAAGWSVLLFTVSCNQQLMRTNKTSGV